MDNDDEHIAGDFFLHSMTTDATRRRTFFEHFQRFVPQQTIIYIQYCLLRIPFILIYDYLFTEKFSSLIEYALKYSIQIIDHNNHLILKPISYILHSSLFHILLQIYLLFLIPILGLLLLILLLLCSDRRLVIFYSYTTSLLVIYFDYQMSYKTDIQSSSSINTYILQFLLSSIYIQMLNIRPRVGAYKIQTRLCHLAPFVLIVTRYLISTDYNISILKFYYIIWTLVHLSELFICHQETIINIIRNRFLHDLYHLYENFGLQTLINYLQTRIHINTLLKIFWLTKIIVLPLGIRTIYTNPYISNVTLNINMTNLNNNITLDDKKLNYNETLVKTIYFTSLFYGTETIFTLISLACLISYLMKSISHRLFRVLHLWTEDVEQIGTVVGVMFFLLLFQSNITRLDLNRRHVPLLKAFSLLIVALFHFLHTILEPQLLKVAMQTMTTRMVFHQTDENQQKDDENTEENKNNSSLSSSSILYSYHHRHVYTCLSILFLVILYIIILWRLTTFSTWLLAVTAFSLELIVRLLASLAQYTLYVLDAHNRLSNVESFDEYIFWIKAITSCFEFILGVFLLFNGFYILCFESRGALRACMLAIHAYLNIIKNLRRGWQIFRNRKSAWDNVNQLPLATITQIEEYNDICSICHNTLTSGIACITPCSHIFHQKCLQKAFYATQNCALCSRPIILERNQHRE
ncbi:unnamed protein product [Rotaria sp. Silwood1]|nr:unnamed protein product [Rotaria sp. Silwood1]CAF1432598.1 unnamed protein product [Rotaria sp. Silwood1]CAF3582823.1 unnamed protein product [Rotaria sp. Silwood1]CAF4687569.1 unnamed protein product [Rotaria sp. Silwood1]CAF4946438.1 unnamed protein product [Rotaria sp. Silwood1]